MPEAITNPTRGVGEDFDRFVSIIDKTDIWQGPLSRSWEDAGVWWFWPHGNATRWVDFASNCCHHS